MNSVEDIQIQYTYGVMIIGLQKYFFYVALSIGTLSDQLFRCQIVSAGEQSLVFNHRTDVASPYPSTSVQT